MNNFEQVKNEIDNIINAYFDNKQYAYFHLTSVTTLAILLANKRNLKSEIAAIIAYCHDIACYRYNSQFDHGHRSSQLTQEILVRKTNLDSKEINTILIAIENHSKKNIIQDPYSELIKDSDLLAKYLFDPNQIFNNESKQRIDNLKNELSNQIK